MSTTEFITLTKANTVFQKRGYRPWTVDILENKLDEDSLKEDCLDQSPLRPLVLDSLHVPNTMIRIGSFLDTALLSITPSNNYNAYNLHINHTGEKIQAKEELTILQQRIQKLESMLTAERELRVLLEEKCLYYCC